MIGPGRFGMLVSGAGTGGPWRNVRPLVAALNSAGVPVTLFCDSDEIPDGYAGVRVVRMRTAFPFAPIASPHVEPSVQPSFATRLRVQFGFIRDATRLARVIRRESIRLLHTHETGNEESPVAARLAGCRRIVGTFHVDPTYDLDRARSSWPYRLLETVSNHCLTMGIAVSRETARLWVRRTALPPSRVAVIPNGIDPDHFRRRLARPAAREQLGLPADGLLIGHVGRLDRAKGPDVLLDAFARLGPVRQDLRVAFAGSGPMADELRHQADRTGFADRVHWLGYLNDVQVALDAFDLFAFPSRCEALSYALLEAMATELACVGSRVGGIPEVIVAGETGLLVPSEDVEALAKALQVLIDRPDLRERFGKAGRVRVETFFHERDMVERTLAVYRKLLKLKRPNSYTSLGRD